MHKQTLRLYWQQVRKNKPTFFTMLLLIPLGALLIDLALPYFLSQAIGALASGNADQVQTFLTLAAFVGAIGATVNFIGFQAIVHHESHVVSNLRQDTFNRLIAKDHQFFANQKIGSMTSRYIDFVRSHVVIQDLFVIRTLGFILSVGGGLVVLWFHSWIVALVLFLFISLLLAQIRWSMKRRRHWRHERKELIAQIHGSVADSLTNNTIVKTFASESRESEHLEKLTKRFQYVAKRDFGFMAGEGSARVALMIVIQLVAISLAAYMVSIGQVDIGLAIFILAYTQRIASQLFTLGDILNGYDQAFLDAAPMTEMLMATNEVTEHPRAKKLRIAQPSIDFDDVSYTYNDGDNHVLSNITLHIANGQRVGLVGPSGAGKTTVTHLLLRFIDVTRGAIRISEQDIRSITQSSLRSAIAYVPQEPALFHRTIRENIAYGNPRATDLDIEEAAKVANAYDFIQTLPQKFDTVVGERGIKLSGGQRQRIAIARAVLKDAPILVLDEATSALDSESEKLIQDALEKLMKGRTSIVIAHRLSTIAKLDRIVVLDKGVIIEDGSHKELLAQNGAYAKLWSHQSGGFIEE